MNPIGLRWGLAALVLLSVTTGCKSYFRVDLDGERARGTDINSLFLIVAKENPFQDGDRERPSGLIRPGRLDSYLLFAQFAGEGSDALTWKQETVDSRSTLITLTPSDDFRTLKLKIDKELLESYPQLTVVAVGHGPDGWYAETMESGKIRNEPGIRLNVGLMSFARESL